MLFRAMALICVLGCLPPTGAQLLHPYEPTPFRREQLDGRSFAYDGMAFLHRLSYQPMPYLGRMRPVPDKVLQGTSGSISRNDFYTRIEATAHIPLEGALYSGYRFRRDEDFDGRFDWNLIGLGMELGQWRFSVWGDVVAEKDSIDTHLDVSWRDSGASLFRFVWVMPDMIFNRKSETAVYEPRPYSIFIRGERRLSGRIMLKGFMQMDNRTELRDLDAELLTKNRAQSAGGSLVIDVGESAELELYAEGLGGERRREALSAPQGSDFAFDRHYRGTTAELRWSGADGFVQWAGLRRLRFREGWSGLWDTAQDSTEDRREITLYWGREMPLQHGVVMIPAVFLGYHEIDQQGPFAAPSGEDWGEADFYGKFAPAVRWTLREDTGAHLTLLLSARLHRPAFGGGNVQVVFPF